MPILFVIIGALGAVAVWRWRQGLLHNAARRAKRRAQKTASLTHAQHGRHPVSLVDPDDIDTPREAATVLMVCVAGADGVVTAKESKEIIVQIQRGFATNAEEASEVLETVMILLQTVEDPHAPVGPMTRVILDALGRDRHADVEAMLLSVAYADGPASRRQMAIIDRFRARAGLRPA